MFEPKAKRKKSKELAWQERVLKQKRGRGDGADYTPFLQVRRGDLSSHGRSEIVTDPVTKRQHHFLSWLECFVWLYLMHLGADEIKEQYPLSPRDDDASFHLPEMEGLGTLALAEILKIEHPAIDAEAPRILSTDLLVSDPWTDRAVFVRYEKDVPRRGRELDLLKLQTAYWRERGIGHYVVTEKHLDYKLIDDLLWSYNSRREHPHGASAQFIKFLATCNTYLPLRQQLMAWRGTEAISDAVSQFKAGVFKGQVWIEPRTTPLRPLNEPWNFKVVKLQTPDRRIEQFFASLEAQDV